MPRARITSKGQITIPKEVRDRLGVIPGDSVDFLFENGHVEVRPVKKRSIAEFRGIFRVERALPFEEEMAIAHAAVAKRITEKDELPES
jgi:AbrB family looped-hinge helix DNA binding protein